MRDIQSIVDGRSKQISLSSNGVMVDVLRAALAAFPESETPGEALKRALYQWHFGRLQAEEILSRLSEIEATINRWQGE